MVVPKAKRGKAQADGVRMSTSSASCGVRSTERQELQRERRVLTSYLSIEGSSYAVDLS